MYIYLLCSWTHHAKQLRNNIYLLFISAMRMQTVSLKLSKQDGCSTRRWQLCRFTRLQCKVWNLLIAGHFIEPHNWHTACAGDKYFFVFTCRAYWHWTNYTLLFLDLPLQSNEVTSSGAIELEGLKRAINSLEDQKVSVRELVTDRRTQVRKHIRQDQPDIAHLVDAWHVAKG